MCDTCSTEHRITVTFFFIRDKLYMALMGKEEEKVSSLLRASYLIALALLALHS